MSAGVAPSWLVLALTLRHAAPRCAALCCAEGEGKYAYRDHGHKFDFLLKPLPPTDEEEAPGAATSG